MTIESISEAPTHNFMKKLKVEDEENEWKIMCWCFTDRFN